VIGEANFSDHGANRLGASALMQGLADGYFIISNTIGDYLARGGIEKLDTSHEEFRAVEQQAKERTQRLLSINGKRTPSEIHRELGKLMWDDCGMERSEASLNRCDTKRNRCSDTSRNIGDLKQFFFERDAIGLGCAPRNRAEPSRDRDRDRGATFGAKSRAIVLNSKGFREPASFGAGLCKKALPTAGLTAVTLAKQKPSDSV